MTFSTFISGLRIRTPLVIAVFITLSFLIYSPALKCGFELDTHYVVEKNPLIKNPTLWKEIFQKGFQEANKSSFSLQLNLYRPVTTLSFALNNQWIGKKPYHLRLINILVHGLNSFLVFLFIYLLWKRKDLGLAAGILFCVLPVHEWAVNYIMGRGDLLQTFFSLSSLLLFVIYLSKQNIFIYLSSLVGFLLALLSKETAMFLPIFLTCTAYYYFRINEQKDGDSVRTINQYLSNVRLYGLQSRTSPSVLTVSLPFYILAAVYFILRRAYFPVSGSSLNLFSAGEIYKWMEISLQYNVRFLLPWSAFHSASFLISRVWFCLILLSGSGYFLYRHFSKIKSKENLLIFGFSISWLLAAVISFGPMYQAFAYQGVYLAERYLYFGSIGFVFLFSHFILTLKGYKQNFVLAAVILFYGIITFSSSRFWTTEEALLRRVSQWENSKQSIVYKQLLYRFDQNIPALKEMIVLSSNDFERSVWSKQLGTFYRQQNKMEDAVKILQQSLIYDSNNFEAMIELAVCYLNNNKIEGGRAWLEKVINRDSDNSEAYRVLGGSFYYQGQYGLAIKNFEKALFLDPDYESIGQFLALSYYFNNQKDAFQQQLDKIKKSHPDFKEVIRFFIKEFDRHRQYDQVVELVMQNQEMFKQDAQMLNLMAVNLFNSGKKERAREVWKQVLFFDPQNKDALNGMMTP